MGEGGGVIGLEDVKGVDDVLGVGDDEVGIEYGSLSFDVVVGGRVGVVVCVLMG